MFGLQLTTRHMSLESTSVDLKTNAISQTLKLALDKVSALDGIQTFSHNPGIRTAENPPSCEKTPQPMLKGLEIASENKVEPR